MLEGVQLCVVQAPDPRYGLDDPRGRAIDVTHDSSKLQTPALASVPRECFKAGPFTQGWNSFITVAAIEARFEWTGAAMDRETESPYPTP